MGIKRTVYRKRRILNSSRGGAIKFAVIPPEALGKKIEDTNLQVLRESLKNLKLGENQKKHYIKF